MDETEVTQQEQGEQSGMQVVPNAGQMGQMGYAAYQNAAMGASGAAGGTVPVPPHPPMFPHPAHQLGFQPAPQFQPPQQQQQQQQLQMFWANQMQEIEQNSDFKNHSLPLARIKKIMKADEDVRMISAEAPVIFAKACEMFIMELTLRSWIYTEENKRRTLQKNDIAAAISRTDVFDFLVDIVPRDELREDGLGVPKANMPMRGSPADMPFYCVPPPQYPIGAPTAGIGMGNPVEYPAAMFASQHPRPSLPYMPWSQTQSQPQQPGDQEEEHKETDN